MKRLNVVILLATVLTVLISPGPLMPQADQSLILCSVSLRQEVYVETIKNPVIENGALKSGDVVEKKMDIEDVGSGTLISKTGLILTNYHVWQFETRLDYDKAHNVAYRMKPATDDMLVYMLDPSNPFKEPKKKYVATYLAGDEDYDIVVMRCTLDANTSEEVSRNDFPFIKLGNPFGIPMNSKINIFGYPGIGGKTFTMTEGKFLGYVSDDDCTVKTDAPISFGNSGGSAIYQDALFGIPTAVSAEHGGASFGYIVPVTRALGPLAEAKMRYGDEIPQLDRKWIASDLNSDLSKDGIFVGGKVISAQTNKGVKDARVWIFRSDRTEEQIDALFKEVRRARTIVHIQKSLGAGKTAAEIAKELELTEDDVQSVSKVNVKEGLSDDAKRYFNGEFFYTFCDTASDGFFFTQDLPVPRHRALNFIVVRDGFRPLVRTLNTTDDLFLDCGPVKCYPY